jgi:integrase|tara:strand:+ start:288 stop:1481 length:1194 start_codon:yes stop_codon:yes gene_type:complete
VAWSSVRKRETKKGISYQASVKEKAEGRSVTVWSGTYKTKNEAQAAAAEYLDGVNKGTVRHVVDKSTFKAFCQNVWLPACRVKVERAETMRKYEMYFNNHWVDFFGSLKMTQIDPAILNRWLELKKAEGLSVGYLARMQGVLSSVFELAVETNAMGTNPLKKKAAARVKIPKSNRDAYSIDEVRAILAFIKENDGIRRDYFFFYLAMTTGLRRGELCGIRLEDIQYSADGSTAVITINKHVEKVRNGGRSVDFVGSSSKKNHNRLVPLDATSTQELKKHLERCHSGEVYGRAWNSNNEDRDLWSNDGWLFHRGNGRAAYPDSYTAAFKRYCKQGGFRYMGLHATRHTVATGLHRANVPIAASASLLGQTPETFLRTYVHISDDDLVAGQSAWADELK